MKHTLSVIAICFLLCFTNESKGQYFSEEEILNISLSGSLKKVDSILSVKGYSYGKSGESGKDSYVFYTPSSFTKTGGCYVSWKTSSNPDLRVYDFCIVSSDEVVFKKKILEIENNNKYKLIKKADDGTVAKRSYCNGASQFDFMISNDKILGRIYTIMFFFLSLSCTNQPN